MIAKKEYAEMLEGFIVDYKEGGWLPRWPSIGERGCMPSTLLDAIIADAAVKGIIGGELLETALEGMLRHANHDSHHPDLGRTGAEAYVKYGYVPADIIDNNCVNLTLDAAYGDYCIAQVAKVLGRNEIVDEYMKRSKNYKNLFDPESGFMRAKTTDGKFKEPFDCFDWADEYTEGSAWQSSFSVPHDIDGLAELYGGKDKLIEKLDELFATATALKFTKWRRWRRSISVSVQFPISRASISPICLPLSVRKKRANIGSISSARRRSATRTTASPEMRTTAQRRHGMCFPHSEFTTSAPAKMNI